MPKLLMKKLLIYFQEDKESINLIVWLLNKIFLKDMVMH